MPWVSVNQRLTRQEAGRRGRPRFLLQLTFRLSQSLCIIGGEPRGLLGHISNVVRGVLPERVALWVWPEEQ